MRVSQSKHCWTPEPNRRSYPGLRCTQWSNTCKGVTNRCPGCSCQQPICMARMVKREANLFTSLLRFRSLRPKSVTVPVFVQPDSEQACLLGMNALPFVGIEVRDSNGIQLLPTKPKSDDGCCLTNQSADICSCPLTQGLCPTCQGI